MSLWVAINQILILFTIMFIGIIAKKTKAINENVQGSISTILIKIGLPALVLSSINFERTTNTLLNMAYVFIISILSYIFFILISMAAAKMLRYKDKTYSVFVSLIVFGNVGFMGYPVARAFFGEEGVFYTAIANLVFALFLWTYGVLLYNRNEKIKYKNLFNVGTISSFLAVLLFLLNVKLPTIVHTALDSTGKMTTPLSMILIGIYIADLKMESLFSNVKVYIISAIRLLILPILTLFTLKMFNLSGIVIAICTIMAAMPSGATNAIFAKEFDSEPVFASVGVFVTTLLSIITLPFIAYLLSILVAYF